MGSQTRARGHEFNTHAGSLIAADYAHRLEPFLPFANAQAQRASHREELGRADEHASQSDHGDLTPQLAADTFAIEPLGLIE